MLSWQHGMASACPQGTATFQSGRAWLPAGLCCPGSAEEDRASHKWGLRKRNLLQGPPSLMGLEAPPLSAGSGASGSAQGTQNECTGPSPRAGGALEPGAAQQGKGSSKGFSTSCPWTLLALKQSPHSFPCTFGWQRHHGPFGPAHAGKPRAQPGPLSALSLLFTGPHSSSPMHKEAQGRWGSLNHHIPALHTRTQHCQCCPWLLPGSRTAPAQTAGGRAAPTRAWQSFPLFLPPQPLLAAARDTLQ